jgi:hypothetical protein
MKAHILVSFLATTFASAAVAAPEAALPPVTSTPATASVVAVARPEITGTNNYLPSNTEVNVTLNSELNSKRTKEGGAFTLSVSHDVMLGDYVVIPRGTRANGHVTFRTGKGVFGKSAKMDFEVTDINLNGRVVPVSGKFHQEGEGNTGATVGTVVAVGVVGGLFVTGHSAVVEQGREFRVFTRDALPVSLATQMTAPVATPVSATPISAAAPQANAQ